MVLLHCFSASIRCRFEGWIIFLKEKPSFVPRIHRFGVLVSQGGRAIMYRIVDGRWFKWEKTKKGGCSCGEVQLLLDWLLCPPVGLWPKKTGWLVSSAGILSRWGATQARTEKNRFFGDILIVPQIASNFGKLEGGKLWKDRLPAVENKRTSLLPRLGLQPLETSQIQGSQICCLAGQKRPDK